MVNDSHIGSGKPRASVESLVDNLWLAISTIAGAPPNYDVSTTEKLRTAFGAYGQLAGDNGVQFEEAMSGAIRAYQMLVDRTGGGADDSATLLLAGIALAAVTRGYESPGEVKSQRLSDDEKQVSRLAALHEISRAATANLRLSEILEIGVRSVAAATGAGASAVFLLEPSTRTVTLRAATGLNPAAVGALTFSADSGITGLSANERRLMVVADAPHHPAWQTTPEMGDEIYSTQVSAPMISPDQQEVVGVLNVLYVEQAGPAPSDLEFVQTVADELALVTRNAQLQSRTDAALRRKVMELGTLQRVSRTVASSLDLPHVLQLVSEAALELTRADAAAVFRLPTYPFNGDTAENPIIEYRVGLARHMVDESPRDLLVSNVIRTGEAQAADLDYADGPSRLYCMPLRSARQTWGALCLRLPQDRELAEDELGLLQAFTDSASLAIENAELYQEARHGLETASTLLQEMHHRVRNNLQTVAALLSLQLRQAKDPDSADQLRDAVSRVQAIASVHDLLSDESRLSGATISDVVRRVIEEAWVTMIPPDLKVDFAIEPSEIVVESRQATILALVINELLSNAIRHGFAGRNLGKISVRTVKYPHGVAVEVENDGQQIPVGFDPGASAGLGMRILQRLVSSDLNGEFTIRSTSAGTVATVAFPIAES